MSMTEPIPDLQWGKGDWEDYNHNWRAFDAEWIQERSILRYPTAEARSSAVGGFPSPRFGQVIYRENALGTDIDRLEMYSKQHTAWVPLLMLANITSTQDNASGVALSHKLALGKGVIFEPVRTNFDNPIYVMSGMLSVDSAAVSIRSSGSDAAKLTTTGAEAATKLVSDRDISAPSITLTGTGTVLTAAGKTISVGAVVATTATIPTINMTGTLSGGIINGSNGLIGGVSLGTAAVGGPNIANAADGFQSNQGMFHGDGSSALMRQRLVNKGTLGTATVKVTAMEVTFTGAGTTTVVDNQAKINGNRSIQYVTNATGSPHNGGPVIYSATDPGVGNVPEGTIWVS